MKILYSTQKRSFQIAALIVYFGLCGCKSVKIQPFFQTESSQNIDAQLKEPQNFTIEPFDFISVDIFSNKGERIVDPNNVWDPPGNASPMMNPDFQLKNKIPRQYLVHQDGSVNLPMIGYVPLGGKTLYYADTLLSRLYSQFYDSVYIVTNFTNKRVTLTGALGDFVIPLNNHKTTIVEAIALRPDKTKNLDEVKAYNVRLIRNMPNDEKAAIEVINLSTFEGMNRAQMLYLRPNDIIYLEPRRKYDAGIIRDIGLIASAVSGVVSVVTILLIRSSQNANP